MMHISLFSGIGGFDLASEWMGWTNIASCEINFYFIKKNNMKTKHDNANEQQHFANTPIMSSLWNCQNDDYNDIDDDYNDIDDDYNDIDDDYNDDEPDFNNEAENCICGAYKLTKSGWKHVADCCC